MPLGKRRLVECGLLCFLKCSSEQELLEFFQVSEGPNAVTFNFFYAGRDNLSDCVKGDGFCSIRNAMILETVWSYLLINDDDSTHC